MLVTNRGGLQPRAGVVTRRVSERRAECLRAVSARGCVELMSGSVSRVTHGVTRVAVEVLRERERCFWGKLQTGWDYWGLHSE